MRRSYLMVLPIVLAACGFDTRDLPPASCPRITILQEGADLTRFRPGAGQDLSAMVADARIAGLDARCAHGRGGRSVEVTVVVNFEVERGPASSGGAVVIPWTLAVTRADTEAPVERRRAEFGVSFPANVTRTRTSSNPINMTFPTTDGRRVTDYNVRVYFQLNEEELAYNRRRGPR